VEALVSSLVADEEHENQRVGPPTILVVGGDSAIGSHLFHEARARGLAVHRTSRRDPSLGNTLRLQLGDDSSTSELLRAAQSRSVTDAVIALGETSIASCANEPSATRLINVTATQHLVETLVDIGVNVMVLSSGAVFSGHAQNPTEESACDPETEYGRQKVELEDATLALEGTRILRLTKVLSPSIGRWSQWIQGIQKGEKVQAFGNVKVSPLRMPVAVGAILKQIELSFGRIVHVSPPDEVTYAGAVCLMAQEMELPVNLEALHVHRDVNRGILPDRWTALGTVYRNPSLQIESSESAMRIFTRQVVG